MAGFVGRSGQVYATELSPERRRQIDARITRASARNVQAVLAADRATGLPDGCCEAIYMRGVFHHVGDRPAFAAQVTRALRPGGRVAVIDFAPGTLWFHGSDHGVHADEVSKSFEAAGLPLRERIDDWGGGMFLLVFER
jgi:ubiquinone/menaquinone biosynthesis C-methylase UbiE